MTAVLLFATLAAGYAVLQVEVRRFGRRRRVAAQLDRLGPVRLRAGLRASKAAQAAAAADGCPFCDEMPCDAGPHFSWVGFIDATGDDL